MSIQNGRWIREQAVNHRIIGLFSDQQVEDSIISHVFFWFDQDHGVSCEFKIFDDANSVILDRKSLIQLLSRLA
ncbi:MAG: hypothetical protein P4K94_08810 [Terracidiphilus sp.]|nr:hypothetical protein [Terracidiphilus sp.]